MGLPEAVPAPGAVTVVEHFILRVQDIFMLVILLLVLFLVYHLATAWQSFYVLMLVWPVHLVLAH